MAAALVLFIWASMGVDAADLFVANANPLAMPEVGSYGLRVLSPVLLELTVINSKDPDPAKVTCWDFVTADFQLRAPAAGEFAVTADGQPIAIQKVGFKRRPLYAPLNKRDLRIANCLYLQLASPIGNEQSVEIKNPSGQLWSTEMQFQAVNDPMRWSPAIHVNQVGYAPGFPKKAMVGYYAGSLGEMPIPSTAGFQLVDHAGQVVFQGALKLRKDMGYTYSPTPYQQVWEADFSSFTTPGEYRLVIPDLGSSFPFLIDEGVAAAFARTYALGVFHQRCGMKEDFPFTRHTHDICHAQPAQVPDMSFEAVNRELANMSGDFANYQSAPQLKDCDSSLYPFVDLAERDVSGGHHDAGDYSKYTINSAGFVHYLVFAADAFPGVVDLDNLGLPESGDGKSDVLQEAKWEADFLAKMQDRDGGFYFLVYPRDREYENDVTPDKGDPQVLFPKTTAVTAAAVAALAEAGSSPAFKRQFPAEAELYLSRAKLGWGFLQGAISQHGKAGAYQKITHYGNEFTHDDELAWAACALFVATGDPVYHQQLKAWYNPSDPNTRRWSWWRMFEAYGCAARSYAFAARSGRLPAAALDPLYLAKCETEIQAAAADQVRFASESAYGTSFPDPNKQYRTAGWYFSSERAFDITVAYELTPRADYLDAIVSGLNYEAGCNPVNVTYITGLGSKRQREIVHQYAENDRRVLPPSGIPLGNIQASYQYLSSYQGDLAAVTYPSDSATAAPYPYYDRWCDTFNTTTEFVITDQARSMASLCFWMAKSSLKDQPWTSAQGFIRGIPAQIPAEEAVTATLEAPGLDLSNARIVWEARDQEPAFGNPIQFAAKSAGDQWVEAEAQLPDGRRVFAKTLFRATASNATPPNSFEPSPLTVTSDMVGLFHLDGDLSDAIGQCASLTLSGNARLDDGNVAWMSNRVGTALQFDDLGDKATVSIPSGSLRSGSDTTAIILEAMVYVDAYVAANRSVASIVSLVNAWDSFLNFGEDMYAGPFVRGGTQMELLGTRLTTAVTPKRWHHLGIEINQGGYVFRVDGNVVATATSNDLANWGRSSTAELELGNFSGWIDEVAIRSVRTGAPPNNPPAVNLVSPMDGATYAAPAEIALVANAGDTDGFIKKVEFYDGTNKLGEIGSGGYSYSFVWNGVKAGTYAITAKATDDRGATTTSGPLSIIVSVPQETAAAPSVSPAGGSHRESVTVSLTTSTPGATIRYTTDGSQPGASSPVFTGPFTLSRTATVRAKAFKPGLAESPITTATFLVSRATPSGAEVMFIKTDSATQGNWKGAYGGDGWSITGDSATKPQSLKLSAAGKADYVWSDSTQDLRALQKASGNGRVAGAWYSSTAFTIDLGFTDGKNHRVSLYFLDWDKGARAHTVEILDPDRGDVLDVQTVSGFEDGKYLVWDIKGHLKFRLTRLSGPNVTLAGLFFGPSEGEESDQPVGPLLSCPPSQLRIGENGFRLHLSGQAGQAFLVESSSDLRTWTALSTNRLTAGELDFITVESGPGIENGGRFYRARALTPAAAQTVIEASEDLIHWTPVTVGAPADIGKLQQADSAIYPKRFYRTRPAE